MASHFRYHLYSLALAVLAAFSTVFYVVRDIPATLYRTALFVFRATVARPAAVMPLIWRRELMVKRTPSFARTHAFLTGLSARYLSRRHGAPLNVGVASCALA